MIATEQAIQKALEDDRIDLDTAATLRTFADFLHDVGPAPKLGEVAVIPHHWHDYVTGRSDHASLEPTWVWA